MFPPNPSEYPNSSYFTEYLNFSPTDILSEQMKNNELFVLNLFESLSDQELLYSYKENKWSIKELIGHICDTEKIFCFRALSIVRGEQNPLPSFDENQYVAQANFDQLSPNQLIQYYFANRTATLAFIETLTDEQLSRKGTANGHEVSARALLWMTAGHEKHHLTVINERYIPLLNKKY